MLWSVCLLAALTAVPLFAILGEVLLRGYDQLSWSFFTEPTPTAYKAMKAIDAFCQERGIDFDIKKIREA